MSNHIEIEELLNGNKIDISNHFLKVDVGLAGEAPNSAIWLSDNNRFVIGVEPLIHHWNMLYDFDKSGSTREYPENFKIIQLNDDTVKFCRKTVCNIGGRFIGIRCAVDDVHEICEQDFYEMDRSFGRSGASSLLSPTSFHPSSLHDVIKTKVVNLEMILDKIDWDNADFKFIEHLKTDCEGKDFDAVKSCGKYLDRIAFVTSEMTNNTHHVNGACDPDAFITFMINKGFRIIDRSGGNIDFVNSKLSGQISYYSLNNWTLGF